MRPRRLALLGVTLLLAPSARAQEQFRLLATIMDSSGIPAPVVDPRDLEIKENGADARIVQVEPANWPVKIQLLLDTGFGLGGENILFLRNGVRGLHERHVRELRCGQPSRHLPARTR